MIISLQRSLFAGCLLITVLSLNFASCTRIASSNQSFSVLPDVASQLSTPVECGRVIPSLHRPVFFDHNNANLSASNSNSKILLSDRAAPLPPKICRRVYQRRLMSKFLPTAIDFIRPGAIHPGRLHVLSYSSKLALSAISLIQLTGHGPTPWNREDTLVNRMFSDDVEGDEWHRGTMNILPRRGGSTSLLSLGWEVQLTPFDPSPDYDATVEIFLVGGV